MKLEDHYGALLGLVKPWIIKEIQLDVVRQKLDIYIEYDSKHYYCPVCKQPATGYDHLKEHIWRHLNVMQFETLIHCKVPRCECREHGVKSLEVPWHGTRGFTLMFVKFACEVLKATTTIKRGASLLGISWHQAFDIMQLSVENGLAKRALSENDVRAIGIDEKSFTPNEFATVVYSHDKKCVLAVKRGRSSLDASTALLGAIPQDLLSKVQAVTMDLSLSFAKAVNETLPCARIIADRFHITKLLNEALDKVRRTEVAELDRLKGKENPLKASRFLWLKNQDKLRDSERKRFDALINKDLKTASAWHLCEAFRRFFECRSSREAATYFRTWLRWVIKSELQPMRHVAKTLLAHLQKLLNYFTFNGLTNARAEGFNSKIQSIKAAARGFRNFEHFRIAILFYCGNLTHTI